VHAYPRQVERRVHSIRRLAGLVRRDEARHLRAGRYEVAADDGQDQLPSTSKSWRGGDLMILCCIALFVLAAILVLALFVTANDRDYWRTSALRLAEENRSIYAELDKLGDELRVIYRDSVRLVGRREQLWEMVSTTNRN
jgi:hypothetical protein